MPIEIDTSKLVRGPKGLRLDAKCAYRDGQAMLTVYGFWDASVPHVRAGRTLKAVLQRVFVPSSTPKAEKHATLRAMCDLIAIEHGESYYLRSKLQ
jgi:hypothetical protein